MSKVTDENTVIFWDELKNAIEDDNFIRMVFGKPKNTDAKKVIVKRFESKGQLKFSCDFRFAQKSVAKSIDFDELQNFMNDNLGATYHAVTLFTNKNDISISFNKRGKTSLTRSKATQSQAASTSHNRQKDYLISPDTTYLCELGVTNKNGEVVPKMYGKFRQIAKFLEIVDHSIKSNILEDKRKISVLDVGSGKGYLTFALYEYLSRKWSDGVAITGVDTKGDLVTLCNKIASKVKFDGLNFEQKNIEDFDTNKVDILVALHACDTATDEALYQGIKNKASLIFCAPCCQHEISHQLRASKQQNPLLQHGLFIEKQADLITDVARTLLLENCGYTVKIIEFVSSEHSMKNTLIVATKNNNSVPKSLDEYLNLKSQFGFTDQRLENLLQNLQGNVT